MRFGRPQFRVREPLHRRHPRGVLQRSGLGEGHPRVTQVGACALALSLVAFGASLKSTAVRLLAAQGSVYKLH